ncbi:MAG: phosphoribosylglycinamide formyltransferase [Gammaproteobacteria bacterium]|nr:MAG: phosphoribosylglycinamide formyltransferase [Gammaproteobacteria bacterium]
MRVVVFASGRGSNLAALIEAQQRNELPIRIVGVFSDHADCGAIALAQAAGIPVSTLDARDFPDRAQFDQATFSQVTAWQAELIVLAGYMRILDARAIAPWHGRIINIHPSLLPKYPGLHTHKRALRAGDRMHGASVHFVTAELDGGPVIAQARVEVQADDTAETLAARLLPSEHRLLVACVRALANQELRWSDCGIRFGDDRLQQPLRLAEDGSLVDADSMKAP